MDLVERYIRCKAQNTMLVLMLIKYQNKKDKRS